MMRNQFQSINALGIGLDVLTYVLVRSAHLASPAYYSIEIDSASGNFL
jgi:hypothetical protein